MTALVSKVQQLISSVKEMNGTVSLKLRSGVRSLLSTESAGSETVDRRDMDVGCHSLHQLPTTVQGRW